MLLIDHPILTAAPARAEEARAHFAARLRFETDCADVHRALHLEVPGFVLLDVRCEVDYARAHIPGSINLPYREISEARMSAFSPDTVFVVYCAGPHCNAAQRAALRIAEHGRPVKEMLGGLSGWRYEGFNLLGARATRMAENAPR